MESKAKVRQMHSRIDCAVDCIWRCLGSWPTAGCFQEEKHTGSDLSTQLLQVCRYFHQLSNNKSEWNNSNHTAHTNLIMLLGALSISSSYYTCLKCFYDPTLCFPESLFLIFVSSTNILELFDVEVFHSSLSQLLDSSKQTTFLRQFTLSSKCSILFHNAMFGVSEILMGINYLSISGDRSSGRPTLAVTTK